MFAIVCLINVNFTMLKGMRNALAVVDLGTSAALVPYFELFGTVPAAFLITMAIAWLMNRMSIHKVFLIAAGGFLLFYAVFVFVFYPVIAQAKIGLLSASWLPMHQLIGQSLPSLAAMLFYSMAELWKVAILSVLFWGLLNQYLSVTEAKRFYSPTILGGSIGSMLAGPLITLCTSDYALAFLPKATSAWEKSMGLMIFVISLVGLATIALYYVLWRELTKRTPSQSFEARKEKPSFSLKESLSICRKSPYLLMLFWIVCADYIAYGLGEVIFLDVLRERFPNPKDYCHYMGMLGTWSGFLTAVFALLITPWLVQRYRWVVASLITPLFIFGAAGGFFLMLWSRDLFTSTAGWLTLTVAFGSLQYCLCRASKYTLFDTAKEIAFIYLPDTQRMQGKLVVDGIGSRVGRGGASILSIGFIYASGGVLQSAVVTGVAAAGIALSSVAATWRLGRMVDVQADRGQISSL